MKIEEREFLRAHENCWTAERVPEFSVVNIHMAEIPASRERIFPELAERDLLLSGRGGGRFSVCDWRWGRYLGGTEGCERTDRSRLRWVAIMDFSRSSMWMRRGKWE